MVFSDVVEVGDVDSHWDARTGKTQNIQTGEIWFIEFVQFKVFAPWQVGNDLLGVVHEVGEDGGLGFVDNCDETFVFCSDSQRIKI